MSKMLLKNTMRDVGKTKARFIAIVLIVMLGVGFLVGLNSTAPSMFKVVENYYNAQNLMDFRFLSTVGFTNEDVDAIKDTEGVDDVMPSYFCDVLLKGDTGSVVRLYMVPESYKDNDAINKLTLREGRLPQSADEIVIGVNRFDEATIGSKIAFASPEEGSDLSDTLHYSEFTVVGIVDSPLYISFECGSTNVGSGKISGYAFVPKEAFSTERYTELYVTLNQLRGYAPYSDEYKQTRNEYEDKLQNAGDLRAEYFYENEIAPAQSSLDEAKATFVSEKSKAEKELDDAQSKIDEGRNTLRVETEKAEKELSSAKEKLESGEAQLRDGKAEFEVKIADAQKEIDSAKKQIKDGKAQLSAAKSKIMEGLYEKAKSLGITREQFDTLLANENFTVENAEKLVSFVELYRPVIIARLDETDKALKELESKLASAGIDFSHNAQYIELKKVYDELKNIVTTVDDFLSQQVPQLIEAVKTIELKEKEIIDSEQKLIAGEEALEKEKTNAYQEFEQAEAELISGRREYEKGLKEFNEKTAQAQKELDDAQVELDKNKKKAEDEFSKAEEELKKAQDEIDSIPVSEWYCLSRDHNPGYASYEDNVGRLTAVAKVFPVFFLLVAILVCVTTMSRLVEEQRADIGALTTLGYRKRSIIGKYIGYSACATVIGAGLGILWGIFTLPAVIFNAYRMLYSSLPNLTLKLDMLSAVLATAVAIVCTSAVSYFACNVLLKKEPASLLRPKAPKPGKRILLEKVKFLWKRLGFFSKVTIRNIVRYKARFLMTVIGIAGCTALIVAAMGLHRSINDVVTLQFEEIFTNDVVIALENPENVNSTLDRKIRSDERFSKVSLCRQNLAEVMTGHGFFKDDTYIVVPENTQEYTDIVNLRERKSGDKVELSTSGVVITEKLAKKLKVSVGDEIRVIDCDIKKSFTVSGICENYLYGYVFMTPEMYTESFGFEPQFNMYMCVNAQDNAYSETALGEEYLKEDGVLGISFIDSSISSFEDMIESLNYVVLVMVVCAAALAFVVLYNLTNINIAERKREISTLKVLGFKNSETSAYIYRENIVLTVVGTLVGLLLGVVLLNFVINTVEIDMVMFGRKMYPQTFIIATILTFIFSAVVNAVMYFRIKKIDMIESLKSIE